MEASKKKAFVIGHPISHSLSPKLHGFWLKEYNIEGTYEAVDCPPEYLLKVIRKMPEKGFVGGNVTIPYKEKVMMIADEVDSLARKVGAANTLVFEDGKIFASNSDVYGFTQNLISGGVDFSHVKKALVLGAGGAARAIIVGLKEQNINVTICNRTVDNAVKLAKEFDADVLEWDKREENLAGVNLLVNTSSLGMKGQGELEINLSALPKDAVVNDIVYNPLETALLKQAAALNLKTVDGLGMLLHQAAPGFEKWFGKKPEVTEGLRNHLLKKL